ncbi:MAG: glycosyltransferase, partial [Armatimonadetes bacterium CG07_land_8_20_14_0_80_40_9]
SLSLQIILKFLETYIYKRGALDGLYGFLVSVLSSFFVFVKWTKLWEMQRKNE